MKFVVYQDAVNEYRWSLVANNGERIADSSEGYARKEDCLHGIGLVRAMETGHTPIEEKK